MSRLRFNNVSPGAVGNPLTFADGVTTTGTWATPPGFPTIVAPDVVAITVEADTADEEIVYLVAFTAGSTTGSFLRAQENTAGIAHASKSWVHGPTAADFKSATTRRAARMNFR